MRHEMKLLNSQSPSEAGPLFQFDGADVSRDSSVHERASPAETGVQQAMVSQLLDIHEYERQRMGQELHDSAGQLLVSLQLSVARLRLMEQNCNHGGLIDEIQETVRQIDQEIRALAFLHYPAELGGRSLCDAVRALVKGFGRRTGIRTSFRCADDGTDVAQPISIAMLRVTQEALVNIHRHSHASCARVVVESGEGGVHLSVSDNGIGIPPAAVLGSRQGVGLQGMRHRVEMHGGQFKVKNLKRGTNVSATMPASCLAA